MAPRRSSTPSLDKQKGVQGSQFTSSDFVDRLRTHGIQQSMDGKGRWVDHVFVERLWKSVKYEEVYLHVYDSVTQARLGTLFPFLQPTLSAFLD